jgi:hypothetical protein
MASMSGGLATHLTCVFGSFRTGCSRFEFDFSSSDTFRLGTFRAPTPPQIFYRGSGSRSDAFAARFHHRSHLTSATPGSTACPL